MHIDVPYTKSAHLQAALIFPRYSTFVVLFIVIYVESSRVRLIADLSALCALILGMENCLKVVVLGGDTAGKTSLILVKTKHKFPYRRVHRLADPTIVRTRIDGKTYTFSVWDTKKVQEREKEMLFLFYRSS